MKSILVTIAVVMGLCLIPAHAAQPAYANFGTIGYISSADESVINQQPILDMLNSQSMTFENIGNPATNPGAFESPPLTEGVDENNLIRTISADEVLYGLTSWKGDLDPQGAFAGMHGNKVYMAFFVDGKEAHVQFKLADFELRVYATDLYTGDLMRPELNYSLSNLTYGTGILGYDINGNLVTDPNALVSKILITTGAPWGINMNQFTGTPEEKRNQAATFLGQQAPFVINFEMDIHRSYDQAGNVILGGYGASDGFKVESSPYSAVPEPSTWALCGLSLLLFFVSRRRMKAV